jgi:hypothetical protein
MNTHADKIQENKSQSVANVVSKKQRGGESIFQFVNNRYEAIQMGRLKQLANNSPRVSQLSALQDMANNSPQAKQVALLQAMAKNQSAQQQQPIQKLENNTGLHDNLQQNVTQLYEFEDGEVLGEWTFISHGDSADLWASLDGEWKMSYYRASGDYHIKGKTGARAKSHKGYFNGELKEKKATVPIGEEMDTLYNDFEENVLTKYT